MTVTNNTQQPLVSFIVTCYNLPVDMLCECIDSILKLSLQPDEREIIVVDDGSEVSPMNDLLKYGDDIIYVRRRTMVSVWPETRRWIWPKASTSSWLMAMTTC